MRKCFQREDLKWGLNERNQRKGKEAWDKIAANCLVEQLSSSCLRTNETSWTEEFLPCLWSLVPYEEEAVFPSFLPSRSELHLVTAGFHLGIEGCVWGRWCPLLGAVETRVPCWFTKTPWQQCVHHELTACLPHTFFANGGVETSMASARVQVTLHKTSQLDRSILTVGLLEVWELKRKGAHLPCCLSVQLF